MNQKELLIVLEKHGKWLRNKEGGERADLRGADLRGANLRGANLDYACWPLWCGSLKARIDDRQVKQLLYHVLSAVSYSDNCSDELKAALLTETNITVANQFHRVDECGALETHRGGDCYGNDHD